MQIPNTLPQFAGHKVLLVVSAKEQGILYTATEGTVEQVVKVTDHPEARSDNEGFFFRSGYGRHYGSGAPVEEDKEEQLQSFVKSISEELNEVILAEKPDAIYMFQPEHLKGYFTDSIKHANNIPIHLVKLGNFVNATPLELIEFVRQYHDDTKDPGNPDSVENGPGAEEKRKILSVGK